MFAETKAFSPAAGSMQQTEQIIKTVLFRTSQTRQYPMEKKVHYIKSISAFLLLSLCTMNASATDTNTYNRVSFQVSEQQQVHNDEITVSMAIERDDQDATHLADEINRLMADATGTMSKFTTVHSQSGDYSIRPVYSRDKQLDHWRGTSTVLLKSRNIKDMAGLVQQLQKSMTIKSTRYTVSAERKEEIETGMIKSAMKKFSKRADLVTAGMGFRKYRLVNININNSSNIPPRPVYAMASAKLASSDIAAPTFDAGETSLTVTIFGTIEMQVAP